MDVKHLKIQANWFRILLPEGILIPSSTLITGPGGSGKPLIGNFFAAEWLRQGGSVVFMSLQYPDYSFVKSGMLATSDLDIDDYNDQTVFIELDAGLDSIHKPEGLHIRANLVKPDIWDEALTQAAEMVPDEGPGILVFGSALNLLLFSPTYESAILEKMIATLKDTSIFSYLFSVSNSVKANVIAKIEAVVDNLLMMRREKGSKELTVRVLRAMGVQFSDAEIKAPLPQETLSELKEIADASRKRVIPLISKL